MVTQDEIADLSIPEKETLDLASLVIIYHAFSDGQKDFYTYEREVAEGVYTRWAKQYENVRLYYEVYLSEEDEENDAMYHEDCLQDQGGHPS